MEENTKKAIEELISKAIEEIAYEGLRKAPTNDHQFKQQYSKNKAQEEIDIDEILFNGGMKNINKRKTINLSEGEMPKVNISDINNFKKKVEERLSAYHAVIIFDKQSNGQVLDFPKVPNGGEVYASGKISLGWGQNIDFQFSLLNGLSIDVDNFKVDDKSKGIIEQLYNAYDEWQKEWKANVSNALNSGGGDESDNGQASQAPPAGGEELPRKPETTM